MTALKKVDPEMYELLGKFDEQLFTGLNLVASENCISDALLEAASSRIQLKYAEGYSGERYYGGCEFVDKIETLCVNRAKKVFKAEYANVQPHSGSQANQAVYKAILKLGDTIIGLGLDEGGHLTHGFKVNQSGEAYNWIHFGVDEHGEIDYSELLKLVVIHKPKMITIGYSANTYMLDIKTLASMKTKQPFILHLDLAHLSGPYAAGLLGDIFPYADIVTMTTHKSLQGPRHGLILSKNDYDKEFPMELRKSKKRTLSQMIQSAVFPGIQGGPQMHQIAQKAVALKQAMDPEYVEYQKQIIKNAQALEKAFKELEYQTIGKGTQNHQVLIDLRNKEIKGKIVSGGIAQKSLEKAGIYINMNRIKNDTGSAKNPSGIRLGTPFLTAQGMKEEEMKAVAKLIDKVLTHHDDEEVLASVREKVKTLMAKFPLKNGGYKDLEGVSKATRMFE